MRNFYSASVLLALGLCGGISLAHAAGAKLSPPLQGGVIAVWLGDPTMD